MCERVKERSCQTRPENPTRLTWNRLSRIFWFRPPQQSSLVPIWSLKTGHHTPAVIVAENRRDRHRLRLEKPRPKPITTAVDSTRIWPRHHLSFVPQDSLFHFQPSIATESHCFSVGQLLEFHDCWTRFHCRCRAWELTTGTIRLSVIGTFRLELLGQRWLNFGNRWPTMAFQ